MKKLVSLLTKLCPSLSKANESNDFRRATFFAAILRTGRSKIPTMLAEAVLYQFANVRKQSAHSILSIEIKSFFRKKKRKCCVPDGLDFY